ncbi:uncharacterized protein KY384_008727 [Bacidia gigantensis]|uniref:uncharacterized protein n=1 Tax=Bacidia gigantensis TaxID=2732470 RepID=UPI001D044600|nr:uncharacterized protein KY384_008727 [Bacidia gigantensis]KAG8526527.1 hypothetical protein KY384_008727 [Bacidia gigantensis]
MSPPRRSDREEIRITYTGGHFQFERRHPGHSKEAHETTKHYHYHSPAPPVTYNHTGDMHNYPTSLSPYSYHLPSNGYSLPSAPKSSRHPYKLLNDLHEADHEAGNQRRQRKYVEKQRFEDARKDRDRADRRLKELGDDYDEPYSSAEEDLVPKRRHEGRPRSRYH